jgi:Protein kinase domain
MTPERYEQLWAIHDEACRLPPEQRESFLDQRCVGDGELRAEVARLLAHAETIDGGGFLEAVCEVNAKGLLAGPGPQVEPGPPPSPPATLIPPAVPRPDSSWPSIPGYQILSVLGRGAMGVVYKALHVKLNRVVALKMILAGAHANAEERRRFLQEAETVARLQHPNVVQIYDVDEHQGHSFLALEFVDGPTLAAHCNHRPQPPAFAAETVEVLARAVHYVHQQGVVHRDLKPGNVLLAGGQTPKVMDFGLARQVDVGPGHTQTGMVLGTPAYMAPEQARGEGKRVGPPADVWALGAVLYDLLTGRPPFLGETTFDTLQRVVHEDPVPVRQLQPKVPRDLETICLKCLQKEPNKRYGSAAVLADDLRRVQKGQPIAARPVGALERAGKLVRRHPAVAALIGALVLVTGLGFGALYQAREAERRADERAELLDLLRDENAKQRQEGEALKMYLRKLEVATKGETNLEAKIRTLDLVMELYQRSGSPGEAVLRDPALTIEDKVTLLVMLMTKAIDQDISAQAQLLESIPNSRSRDVETMKLKRLIDKRSQTFDMLREIIDKQNETAKGIIDSVGR